jgi:hypothetical protein
LSRSRATPAPDTPPDDVVALEEATATASKFSPLDTAIHVFTNDPHFDGDPPTVFVEEATLTPSLGPRQQLLENAPCHKCHLDIPPNCNKGLICDRCNRPYHLSCLPLDAPPRTYWYCPQCSSHIAARGIASPTEDIRLQSYLLGQPTPPHLLGPFQQVATTLTFTDQLYTWHNE